MSEKNMGRKFKVGDKVKLTKEGEEADFFSPKFRKGDIAEIIDVNSFDGSISRVMVTSGEAKGYPQLTRNNTEIKAWFKHVKTKKKHKKKRKHFRMGDFVTLKDGVCLEECSIFGDITHSTIGVVCGMEYDGALIIHFTTETGYNFDRAHPKALRLANKEERKALRNHKVAKITYNDLATEEIEQDTETLETKTPPEYDVKAGDVVEVTLDVNGHPIGTIGEVVLVREDSDDYYNSVKVRDNKGILWNELDVKLVYRKPETKSK